MRILRKYSQKKKIKDLIYKEYEKALIEKDYVKSGILSKRFIKISKL